MFLMLTLDDITHIHRMNLQILIFLGQGVESIAFLRHFAIYTYIAYSDIKVHNAFEFKKITAVEKQKRNYSLLEPQQP